MHRQQESLNNGLLGFTIVSMFINIYFDSFIGLVIKYCTSTAKFIINPNTMKCSSLGLKLRLTFDADEIRFCFFFKCNIPSPYEAMKLTEIFDNCTKCRRNILQKVHLSILILKRHQNSYIRVNWQIKRLVVQASVRQANYVRLNCYRKKDTRY